MAYSYGNSKSIKRKPLTIDHRINKTIFQDWIPMETLKRIKSLDCLPKKCQMWWKEEINWEYVRINRENEDTTQKWI